MICCIDIEGGSFADILFIPRESQGFLCVLQVHRRPPHLLPDSKERTSQFDHDRLSNLEGSLVLVHHKLAHSPNALLPEQSPSYGTPTRARVGQMNTRLPARICFVSWPMNLTLVTRALEVAGLLYDCNNVGRSRVASVPIWGCKLQHYP